MARAAMQRARMAMGLYMLMLNWVVQWIDTATTSLYIYTAIPGQQVLKNKHVLIL
jgi:hypothetical protein